uniref:hypothetical protein n=1 Tax=Yoonia sp. TaxID=2212373 RepID=UPI004047FC04
MGGSRTPLTGETESVEAGRQAGGAARVDLETGMLTVRSLRLYLKGWIGVVSWRSGCCRRLR